MKTLVILGHPSSTSLCSALAKNYEEGAKASGAKVKTLQLGKLKFDPIMHWGYQKIQKLEPDLEKAQKLLKWADHICFVYPTWWGAPPALLKGFVERCFLPGFAFKFRENGMWDKLFKGKSARLIVTMDSPKIFYWLSGSPGHKMMKRSILDFCGIKPIKTTELCRVRDSSNEKRKRWLKKVRILGKKDSKHL